MQAAFYVKHGPAREVLQVGEQPTLEPGPGEVSQRPDGADVGTVDHSP
jgi:NADPH2:quinone reductase